MIHVKCAECECYPEDCKKSDSPLSCPNCTLQECCCWPINKLQPPQLEVIETILRELLLEYDSQEVKRMWHRIHRMS